MAPLIKLNSLCFKNILRYEGNVLTAERVTCFYLSSGVTAPYSGGIRYRRGTTPEEAKKTYNVDASRGTPCTPFKPELDWNWNEQAID